MKKKLEILLSLLLTAAVCLGLPTPSVAVLLVKAAPTQLTAPSDSGGSDAPVAADGGGWGKAGCVQPAARLELRSVYSAAASGLSKYHPPLDRSFKGIQRSNLAARAHPPTLV